MQKKEKRSETVTRARASVVLSVAAVVFTGLTVLGLWLMRHYLSEPEWVRELIGRHYLLGALCMILISMIQVVVALVPGELVEIAAGFVFGSWGGALLCLAGNGTGKRLSSDPGEEAGQSVRVCLLPQGKDRGIAHPE